MRKNSTLLMKHYELTRKINGQLVFQALTPLFQITAHKINMNKPLRQIVNNPRLNYSHLKKLYDRILVIYNVDNSPARRNVLVNIKRNDLIQFINKHGNPSTIYTIYLPKINQFVPTSQLVNQLQVVIRNKKNKITSTDTINKSSIPAPSENQKRLLNFKNRVLFPFNMNFWEIELEKAFPKSKSLNRHHISQSYFFMQVSNMYMIQFCPNKHYMYLDMKDFDAYLSKFNFIRFFYQFQIDNHFLAQKYAQRLIKSIKWRTRHTQQYLLMNIRSGSWQRFIIIIQDFCHCYETLHMPEIQADKKQNNSII